MMKPISAYFLLISFLLFSLFALLLTFKLKFNFLIAYFISINLTLFLLYLYDKINAKLSGLRVPEIILHLFTLLGGSLMAIIAQRLLSHKKSKKNFQTIFKKILIFQALIIFCIIGFILYSA